jgi:predicted amidohydrolase
VAIERLQSIARDRTCAIVAGTAFPVDGALRNSAIVIDRDGSIAGRADKYFLWHFDRKWFTRGDRLEPIDTALGKLGVLVCADGRMPGIARQLVDRGAELLVMPTAWVTSGRDPNGLENVQADLLARVRAFENNVPFVAANKCGVEDGMVAYCGKSQIVDRSGNVLVCAPEHDEALIAESVQLTLPAPHRAATPAIASFAPATGAPLRVALSPFPLPPDIRDRLSLLDDDVAIGPSASGVNELARSIATVSCTFDDLLDPGWLIPHRIAGARCAVVETSVAHPWFERVVRARALELRMYVIAIVRDERAFCVDPDGAVVAGTFDGYRLASVALDPRRTEATLVAPGTDVAEGLAAVAALAQARVPR